MSLLLVEMKTGELNPKLKPQPLCADGQLVDAVELLKILFPQKCRPTLRWLRDQQEQKRVPFRKIGRLVFFDPSEVREAWRDRFTVGKATNGVAR